MTAKTPLKVAAVHFEMVQDEKEPNLATMESFISKVQSVVAQQTWGYLRGLPITSILQLLEMERKTATLNIHSTDKQGSMFFHEGRLIDATAGDLVGDDAAMEIIAWENTSIEIDTRGTSPRKSVSSGLQYLMMESLRLKDERGVGGAPPSKAETPLESAEDEPAEESLAHEVSKNAKIEALEACLEVFPEVRGLSAVAVVSPAGKLLASWSGEKRARLEDEVSSFDQLAREAHKTAQSLGLEGCSEITFGTRHNLIMVQGPEIHGEIPFRVVALLDWDSDQGAFARSLGRILPKILKIMG